jgi:hypothetical protein
MWSVTAKHSQTKIVQRNWVPTTEHNLFPVCTKQNLRSMVSFVNQSPQRVTDRKIYSAEFKLMRM